jgi:hypothetical protein
MWVFSRTVILISEGYNGKFGSELGFIVTTHAGARRRVKDKLLDRYLDRF